MSIQRTIYINSLKWFLNNRHSRKRLYRKGKDLRYSLASVFSEHKRIIKGYIQKIRAIDALERR